MASERDVYRNTFRGDQLASAALVSARRAVRYHDGKTELDAAYAAILYALDPTDEAMVEAAAVAGYKEAMRRWEGVVPVIPYESLPEADRAHLRDMFRAAIAAIRDHITGEGA
jgi:hypothetical protein